MKEKISGEQSLITKDGKIPNAVLVRTDGTAELIHLDDFVDPEALGTPLDCGSTDMVLNRLPIWSKKSFGKSLAGYVDKNGIPKGLDENEKIEEISGYDYIAGDCVIVAIDGKYNYLPLSPEDAAEICEWFN